MTNRLVPIPLPIKGLNTVNPFIGFESGYARELTNYSLYNGRVWRRPAVRSHVYNASFNTQLVKWFDATDANNVYAILATGGLIRNLSTGSGATDIGGSVTNQATRCKHVSLDLIFGLREPRLATNPFTAWTFTTLGITATAIVAGCSHRGRLYVTDGSTIEVSTLGAVTGTMDQSFSVAPFLDGQTISRMFSTAVSPTLTTENVLVIFGTGGKVLVYQGDYPNHASWSLVAKYDMAPPITGGSILEIDGDIWVSTTKYAYWFVDLFTSGPRLAVESAPSKPIQNLWDTGSTGGGSSTVTHVFYEPYLDAICVQFSGVDSGLDVLSLSNYGWEAFTMAYFRKYDAWAFWMTAPLSYPVLNFSSTLYGGAVFGEVVKIVHGNTTDTSGYLGSEAPIETSWKTPYLSTGKSIKLNGCRVHYESTVNGYFEKIRSIFDFSDYNSPVYGWYTQSTVTQVDPGKLTDFQLDLPTVTWDQYAGFAEVGGSGGAVSLQFTIKAKSASSTTQDQSIYAATMHIEDGGELFG